MAASSFLTPRRCLSFIRESRSGRAMPDIRKYRPTDFEQLWKLDQTCFPADIAYSRNELAYYLAAPRALCFVVEDHNEPVAFILGHQQRGNVGHIVTLDVVPQAQRKRLGSVLMEKLESSFVELGCSSLMLEVAVSNLAALTFYKKHGFTVIKTLRHYYPGGLDGLLMGKKLSRETA